MKTVLALCICLFSQIGLAADYKLTTVKKQPAELPETLAGHVEGNGHQLSGKKGVICTIWLGKDVEVKPDFQPGFSVKYPFQSGQLLAVVEVPKKSTMTDFRGQEVKPGLYTFRYGLQPEDGNHIGTSETADFLLLLPLASGPGAKPIASAEELFKASAKSVGSAHPAIFFMKPVEKVPEKLTLEHDEDHEFWILSTPLTATAKGKKQTQGLQVVLVGRGLE